MKLALFITFFALAFVRSHPIAAKEVSGETPPAPRAKIYDKAALVNMLRDSLASYEAAIKPASDRQWRWKPAPDSWSMAEITEHLLVSEELFIYEMERALKAPPRPDLMAQTRGTDALNEAFVLEEKKHTAAALTQPLGRFPGRSRLVEVYRQRRQMTIDLIEKTPLEELRSHVVFRPGHPSTPVRDMVQLTIVYGLHTTRHQRQVERVKAHPGYPPR
jgi:hypothetical protein